MTKKLIIAIILFASSLSAQTYFGEVLTPEGFEYMRLQLKEDSTFVSFPYEFRQTFSFPIKASKGKSIEVNARAESRKLTFKSIKEESVELSTNFTGYTQSIKLLRRANLIKDSAMPSYSGNFSDDHGNRAIVYIRNGILHLMSPYAEQTVSLKPIGKNQFWSISGETTRFSEKTDKGYRKLTITNRGGQSIELQRSFDFRIAEDWIPVDGDSIYVNMFIPNLAGRKPACLLLPGGGGRSQMENFEYEARLFASHGMVAMTFDKSGVGKSKGISFENYSFDEKAQRYEQLFKALQAHAEVDAEKVGVHGPSEGGRLALMMGINLGGELAFINTTAAPIMTMMEGQLYAASHYSRNMGMSESDMVTVLHVWRDYYSGILNQQLDTTNFSVIRELRNRYQRAFLPPQSRVIPLSPSKEDLVNNRVVGEASKIKSPVFLQYGENDERVDPMRSLQNFYQNASDELSITAEIYRRGNHSMMTPEFKICSGYAYDKIKWLRSIGIIE